MAYTVQAEDVMSTSRRILSERSHRQRGMTAVELVVTIAVIGTLIATAATSFQKYREQAAVRGGQWLVYNLLVRARSEAISQGRRIGTDDLLYSASGSAAEAPEFSQWLGRTFSGRSFTVTPEAISFDGRGQAVIEQDFTTVTIETGTKSRTVQVDRGGFVYLE